MTLASRELGATGLELCTLGFGGAAIGNLYRELRDEDAGAAVRESFTAGVRYFDTAPFYGFGLSELRLGKALHGAQPPPVISTKVGRRLVPTGPQDASVGREGYFSARPFAPVFDYGYDSVMRSHAESLERLGVSRVDILLCHDIGRLTHGDLHGARVSEFLEGGYRAMRELRDAGAVRAIGLGVNEWEVCVELLESCELDCILLAGRYTLLEQPALAAVAAVMRAAPRVHHLRRALQLRDPRRRLARRRELALQLRRSTGRNRRSRGKLESLCAEFDVPLRAAALQFPLAHPGVASVVAGCANGAEARDCAAMFSYPIPAGFWHALRDRGLVDAQAPVPA